MKNIIEFYYNIRINELHNKDDYYFFDIDNKSFLFKPFYYNDKLSSDMFKLNLMLSQNTNVDNIILNKYNSVVTLVNNEPYILVLKFKDIMVNLSLISNISNIKLNNVDVIKDLERNNWEVLWANVIDYYEEYIGQNEKKYPLLRESFDYFIGLAENAISYLVNTKRELNPSIYDKKVVSHNNLYDSLYDPSNIILDHKARDLAEYIKLSFFNNNNNNIFMELEEYFNYNYYSYYGIRVLYARILYPSFFFNLLNDIIISKKKEKDISNVINRISEYEIYLYKIYLFLQKYYNIPSVEWLKK